MASPSCSVATEEEAERGKPHTLSIIIIKSNYYCTGCLVSAINCMLQDSAFSLDTERVREGLDAAKKTKAWILHNRKEGQFFEQQLTKFLKKCFSSGVSTNAAREMVWGHYHKLRSSPAFRSLWKILLTLVGCSTTDDPIFMQYITHHIFKQLLKEEFPLQPAATHDSAVPALSDEENNVVRYVAGYICNKLYKRLMKSKTDHDLTYGIVDMVERISAVMLQQHGQSWLIEVGCFM